jgi:hypothetical protein
LERIEVRLRKKADLERIDVKQMEDGSKDGKRQGEKTTQGKNATNFEYLAVRGSPIRLLVSRSGQCESNLVFKPGLRSRKPMDCRTIRFSLCPKHNNESKLYPRTISHSALYLSLLHKKTLE